LSGIFVTGAGGLVGKKLVKQLLETELDSIHAVYHQQPHSIAHHAQLQVHVLDLTTTSTIANLILAKKPQLVIHAAAMTNVDACEREHQSAYTINVSSTAAIAQACAAVRSRLLYISTDYVFDGTEERPGPYAEDAAVNPLSYYGATKLGGEEAVKRYCEGHTSWAICRTSVVYGYDPTIRPNFATWLIQELSKGREVHIVTDQFNTPTLADHLASMLITVGQRGGDGIYHIAGADCLSRLSFALQIGRVFDLDTSLLIPTTTAVLRQAAPRPLFSGLRCDRISKELGIRPLPLEESLAIFRAQCVAW
jgi:dTDP-4-dehydrorhamnose reductase